jgi:RNAse (barnase) inhibitor barstar
MDRPEFLQSAVNLYFKPAVLERDIAVLREAGYRIITADASAWNDTADMHRDLAEVFGFPAHYGRNWAALNDCLSDVRSFYWDLPPATLRIVLVLRRFDVFASRDPEAAHLLLDIYTYNQRDALIVGDHLICLVQSDDPDLQLAPVGATRPEWNRDEWLTDKRRL